MLPCTLQLRMLQRFVLHHHHVARFIISQHAALQPSVAQRCSLSLVQERSLAGRPSVRARVRVVVRACMRGSGGMCHAVPVCARVHVSVCVLRVHLSVRVRVRVRVGMRA